MYHIVKADSLFYERLLNPYQLQSASQLSLGKKPKKNATLKKSRWHVLVICIILG